MIAHDFTRTMHRGPKMPVASVADFVAALQALPLLTPKQQVELPALQQQFSDPWFLAEEVVRRGWLTKFQARQLLAGKGNALVLDQYVLLDLLGEGGMGAVYKAQQTRVDRLVALKLIRPEALKTPGAVERFRREARTVAKLAHPQVVTLHDANEVNGTHFLVMEYIEGIDLARLIEQEGRLPVARACDCIRQAALGLQHAHEKGLVHRDIKPHNLMLSRDGTVKLMDLGLARTADTAEAMATRQQLTGTGMLMGTADFLAPEQAQDARRADIRADIYALGCSLYHLLAGEPPFATGTLANKIAAHMFTDPTPIEEVRPEVLPALGAVLRRMMAKKPEQRYQTPADVALALAPFARDEEGIPSPTLSVPAGGVPAASERPPAGTAKSHVARTARPGSESLTRETLLDGQPSTLPSAPGGSPVRSPRTRHGRRVASVLAGLTALALVGAFLLRGGVSTNPPRGLVANPLVLDLGDGMTLELVRIPAGSFLMGSPGSDKDAAEDEKPQHEVTISKDFYLGKYLVTQEQYQQIMDQNPSSFSATGDSKRLVTNLDTRRFPVETVSWTEAQAFCEKLSALTKRRVELPTEAEWEHACRANTKTRYYSGDELKETAANFNNKLGRPTEVGTYPANPWGLHDMTGNVRQWCADSKRKYSKTKAVDIRGPDSDRGRTLRGGCWSFPAGRCRCASRGAHAPSLRLDLIGFRVAVRLE